MMCTSADCLFSDWLQDCQVTQVSMDFPVPLVTRELQDIQDHQANQELVVLVQVIYTQTV